MKKKRLNLVTDNANWALSEEKKNIQNLFETFGYKCESSRFSFNSNLYYLDRYKYISDNFNRFSFLNNRIAVDYFHGDYENKDFREILKKFISLSKKSMVRVSTLKMFNFFSSQGMENLMRIPIGLSNKFFDLQISKNKTQLREQYKIPFNDFVIGSFQKDDVGWDNKGIPKLIKGPDIFIEITKQLKKKINNLHVLLTGPGRNYLKKELKKNNINFTHIYFDDYLELKQIYHILDLYLVSSRDEGGPKSILESMCCEIPVVSSKVGQAEDIIKHEFNGFLYDIKKLNEATDIIYEIYKGYDLTSIKREKTITARENTVNSQREMWGKFLEYFK